MRTVQSRGRCRFSSYPRPIRITWQMQMWCLVVCMLLCSLFVADLIVGMEEIRITLQTQRQIQFPEN